MLGRNKLIQISKDPKISITYLRQHISQIQAKAYPLMYVCVLYGVLEKKNK